MKIKSKGIRIDKEGNLKLHKRCKEYYWINQPERLNPEDSKIHVPAEHFFYIAKELRKKCPCITCKKSIELENMR